MTLRVLIAPDKFKGSLTAAEVAAAVAAGLATELPDAELIALPVADGGEGTVAAALGAGFVDRTVRGEGPLGDPVEASIAVRGTEAVVELAAASGLDLLGSPTPEQALRASSHGTGQLVKAALDAGCREIILGVGGSACTDGGAGLLTALGVRLLDASGRPVAPGGGGLATLATVDLAGLDPRIAEARFVLASDVTNPLLGTDGAAAVYGPQKGADPITVRVLDDSLGSFAAVLGRALETDPARWTEHPGAGAAGGVGFAALAVLGADQRAGIDVIIDLVDLRTRLAGVDLVITGEGSLDDQSLAGKAPTGVARLAREHGVPTIAVCGRSTLRPDQAAAAGFAAIHPLTDLDSDLDRCIRNAAELLCAVAAGIGHGLRTGPNRNPNQFSTD
ncbi:MAG: glycerate kinase [Propionibacteriaceae bacterium]